MKLTKDTISREQTKWLALHAIFLLAVGVLISVTARNVPADACDREPRLQWLISLLGGATMIGVGAVLFVVSVVRLRQPFTQERMQFKLRFLLLGEALVLGFGGSTILDCGEIGFRLMLGILCLNVCLLGFRRL